MSQYVVLTMLDVFQLCYFGETMKTQSSHISDALLRCSWYLCGGPFRRILSIILSNSTKPLVMTGGKFFILDFHKLTSVSQFTQIENMYFFNAGLIPIFLQFIDNSSIIFVLHPFTEFGKIGQSKMTL